jgi:hypothetical protein
MNRCIAVLALSLLLPVAAAAQGTQLSPEDDGIKTPSRARLLAVVFPGGGQFYAQRTDKALAIAGTSLMSASLGAILNTGSGCGSRFGRAGAERECWTGTSAPLYVGLTGAALAWAYGIVTAPADVHSYNAGLNRQRMRPVIRRGASDNALLGVSLTLPQGTR